MEEGDEQEVEEIWVTSTREREYQNQRLMSECIHSLLDFENGANEEEEEQKNEPNDQNHNISDDESEQVASNVDIGETFIDMAEGIIRDELEMDTSHVVSSVIEAERTLHSLCLC